MKVFALLFPLITIIFAQETSLPNVNCDEMVATTGKRYHEIYVPHESNCNSFYQCTDHGLVQMKCLRGLVFFPYINGCVVQTDKNCITWNQWRSLNH